MKVIFILIALAALAFAANDGCTTLGNGHNSPTTDNVVLTVLHNWSITSGNKALGLDIVEDGAFTFIVGTDNVTGHLRAWDASTGESIGTITLDEENAGCFGVSWNNTPATTTYYTSDWDDPVLYYTEDGGTSWTTVTSPAGNRARGMDFDGTDYWTTNGAGGGLWRFQPGLGAENLSIPEVPSDINLSGLAVWNYNGNLAVAVTTYQDFNIWIYIWDGSTLTFHGSAALPVTPFQGLGLAYSENNGHLYWSYRDSSGIYHLVAMAIDMVSLSRDSWAGIKTSF